MIRIIILIMVSLTISITAEASQLSKSASKVSFLPSEEEVNEISQLKPLSKNELEQIFINRTLTGVSNTGEHAGKPANFIYSANGENLLIETPIGNWTRRITIKNSTICNYKDNKGPFFCLEVRKFNGKYYGTLVDDSSNINFIWIPQL